MTKILLTGATGHAGSFLVEKILNNTDWTIISLERIQHSTPFDRLAHLNLMSDRYQRFHHDFRAPLPESFLSDMARKIDFIVHNGAEVHAIRSLVDPESFVQSNVIGTFHILEAARKIQPTKFIYTSSAEVLGPAAHNESFNEEAALCPSNPYSASKAGGEMLVHAYRRSFAVPGIITRTMNLFGERQQNSKSVPMFTKKILEGEPVPLHIGPDGRYGTRQWMYVGNYVDALLFILGFGHIGETYHVAGYEQSNIDIAKLISEVTGCPLIVQNVDVSLYHKAHDLRYSISGVKIHEGGWSPRENFASTFSKTIRWYMEHRDWLDAAI